MARAAHFATLGVSLLSRQSSPAMLSKLNYVYPVRLCSSQPVYKIDHSGFVNPLEPNPPRNDQLGIRDAATNRNPRVLELMNISRRREGWTFQAPKRNYQNKLVLEMSGRYVSAHLEHSSGEKVVWATSQEHPLMTRLYSLSDISAVKAVARVFARRCLKAGIHQLAVIESHEVRVTSQRLAAFLDILTSAGIALEEPAVVLPPQRLGVNYDVVNPNLYHDEEAQSRIFPKSSEEYDPEIDVSFDDEGLTRKHQTPMKTWEDYRPLVDPEPIDYAKALKEMSAPAVTEEFVKKGGEIEAVIEPVPKLLD